MRSFRVGSAFGIPIQVNLSFLVILPVFAWLIGSQVGQLVDLLNGVLGADLVAADLSAGSLPLVLGAVAAIGLFGGVLLHEFGHALTAMHYGFTIDSISLWFLGGIAQFTEMPEDWRQELTVAIAGPVVSLALGVLSYLVFLVVPESLAPARFVVGYLAVMNVALAGFNMLPGFPMDGGRVLRAWLARNRPYARATQLAADVGKGFAFLLAVFGLFGGGLFLIAVAFFIYVSAASESQQVTTKAALEGVTVADVMTPVADLHTVDPDDSVADLMARMFQERHTGYPVIEAGDLVGMVTLSDAQEVREVERDAYRVEEVMTSDLRTVPSTSDAMHALTEMQRHGVGRLPVVDDEFVGLLSRTDLLTALSVIRSSGSLGSAGDLTAAGPRRPEDSLD